MTDVYTSVGVVVGLLLAELTGWVWVDAVVGLLVGLNIMWHGWQLVWRSSQGLMDVAVEPQQLQVMEAVLAQQVLAAKSETGASISFDGMHTRQAGSAALWICTCMCRGSGACFRLRTGASRQRRL